MRILLVLPRDRTYRRGRFVYNKSLYAPLTLTTLAALVPEELGATIQLVDEGVQRFDYHRDHWDLVGITGTASGAPRAYELADAFRRRGSVVFLGGPHATLNPDEAVGHADVVVAGYAERVWPQLLRQVAAGERPQGIFRELAPPQLQGVVPRRDLLEPGLYITRPTIIASRGCPNCCAFCAINETWNRSPCSRPVAEVVQEIEGLGSREILFLDPNLNGNRAYAQELFEALIPLGIRWAGLATLDIADDPKLFDVAVRSGCEGLLFGFETASQETMDACRKSFIRVDRTRDRVRRLHDHGISVLGCVVVGFDQDTPDTVARTVEFLDQTEVDLIKYAILTPYPGTILFRALEREGRILSRDWADYDTEHVVFRPRQMTPEQLQESFVRAWRETYTAGRIAQRVTTVPGRLLKTLFGNIIFRYHFPTTKHPETRLRALFS